jgi:hypothetical protein
VSTLQNLIDTARAHLDAWGIDWNTALAAGVAGIVALVVLAMVLRRFGRSDAATTVTTFATVLGLGWSAQGMWDTAVNRYDQNIVVASVLFVVFELMLMARMLRARQYRKDYGRRARHVTAVWLIAFIMAAVVALGEGWSQAPGRLAIPLLVAYGWYTDLTADDDPAERPKTSWRWTPRRALLAIGALEPGARDAQTIDRDRLRDRLTRLAFRLEHGATWLNDPLHREVRLAKLKTLADDADLAEVRARLARMSVDLMAAPPVPARPAPLPKPKEVVKPAKPDDRMVQGVHLIEDRVLRGVELHDDGVARVIASAGPGKPDGISNQALAELYTPPLGKRTAEKIGAEARRRLRSGDRINGNRPDLSFSQENR